jgi:serine/threonine protein kinase
LGDYRLIREIGRGGMGIVYEAEQLSLSRRVALKILPFAAVLDPRHLQRFKNEALAAAHLSHPHIVDVYGIGCERSIHFYAMRLIEGQTLAAVIDGLKCGVRNAECGVTETPLPPGEGRERETPHSEFMCATAGSPSSVDSIRPSSLVLRTSATETSPIAALSTLRTQRPRDFFRRIAELGIQAAEALDHAHQMGIVHRDIKPSNLIIECSHLALRDASTPLPSRGEAGRGVSASLSTEPRTLTTPKLWITDFGLARIQNEPGMTMTGDLLGTLRYMSPEQALAKRITVDHRTDIYSLGITLYELLALQPAFDGRDRGEVLRQIAFEEPTPLRRLKPSIPVELETIIHKSISKNPDDRYATTRDLADDLSRFYADQPIRAKPPTPVQRAMRWSRRHPGVLISGTLMLSVALLAAIVAAAIANGERGKTALALNEKDRALIRAEEDLGIAVSAVDDMYTDLATSWIANETAPTKMQTKFLQRAVHFYEQIAGRTQTTDKERVLAAQMYGRIGQIHQYLGNAAQAAAALRESNSLDEDLVAKDAEQLLIKTELPSRYRRLAATLIETADNSGAEEAYRTGLAFVDQFARRHPSSVEAIVELAHFYHGQAALWIGTDQLDRAEAAVRLAAEQIQKLWELERRPQLLTEPNGYLLARILVIRGQHAQAREQAEKALKSCRRLRTNSYRDAREPAELETDLLLLLGELSEAERDLEQAAERYREVLDLRRSFFLSRRKPTDFFVQNYLQNQDNYDGQFEHAPFCRYIETQLRLSRVLDQLRHVEEAGRILGECTLASAVIWADRPNVLRYHVADANGWAMMAELLRDEHAAEAEAALAHARLTWEDILARFPHAARYRSGVHGQVNDFEWFRGKLPQDVSDSLSPRRARDRLTRPRNSFTGSAADRNWQDAEQSAESGKADRARAWLHLAMSHALLGDEAESSRWYDKAMDAIKTIDTLPAELAVLRAQAEQIVGNRLPEFRKP